MNATAQIADLAEFPFVAELPKRERKRVETAWDRWEEAKEIMRSKGTLVPATFAATLGAVSRQRLSQLISEGVLDRVQIGSHVFVTEESFVAWVRSERKTGRPCNLGPSDTVGQVKFAAKVAMDWARGK